jgi:STAS-like domain of unknown function (DUF4325)
MTEVQMASKQVLLVTRDRGRQVARELPKEAELRLDFKGVEVASPSFLDELIKGIAANGTKKLVFLNVSKSTRDRLDLLRSLQSPTSTTYPILIVEEPD